MFCLFGGTVGREINPSPSRERQHAPYAWEQPLNAHPEGESTALVMIGECILIVGTFHSKAHNIMYMTPHDSLAESHWAKGSLSHFADPASTSTY